MIVRTYGRRSSNSNNNNNNTSRSSNESLSQESPQDLDLDLDIEPTFNFAFTSQESNSIKNPYTFDSFDSDPYSFDSDPESRKLSVLPPRSKKLKMEVKDKKGKNPKKVAKEVRVVTETATLMETQEFGEMMEHADEVEFALDGLRRGQPVRIRRASLLSLLMVCGTLQQRRLLRTHGTAKTVIDAVLGLNLDDTPSNLAAAAVFFVLTNDGHEDYIMDSPNVIRFLLKLLKPATAPVTKNKVSTLGSKLVALSKDASIFNDGKGDESSANAILQKVEEILVSCKELKPRSESDSDTKRPELNPKWLALLTMEKACLSTVSLEETTGTVRKMGGNFKEKLREHGGLDAVIDIIRECHGVMEGWLKQHSSPTPESKITVNLESPMLLLKCLKILENATFLSIDNQSHLLGVEDDDFDYRHVSQSSTKLILSVIKILSGVSLLKESSFGLSNGTVVADDKAVDNNEIICISSSIENCSMDQVASQKTSKNSQSSFQNQAGSSKSDPFSGFNGLSKTKPKTSTSKSIKGAKKAGSSQHSMFDFEESDDPFGSEDPFAFDGDIGSLQPKYSTSKSIKGGKKGGTSQRDKFDFEESQDPFGDPFAFDEEDGLTTWDVMSGKKNNMPRSQKRNSGIEEDGDQESDFDLMMMSQQDSTTNAEPRDSPQASCSHVNDDEKFSLLADCLLAAVKVLMNLTNDNPVGCQQIATCGGLETLCGLIAGHYPSFNAYLPSFGDQKDKSILDVDNDNNNINKRLNDQELDFLVAILGLLVNLVEKDGHNRARLAATSISVPKSGGLDYETTEVIPLLCSIFLANQGAGEAAEEERQSAWNNEDLVLEGEKEAEKTIVEAYSALLLAFLSTESKSIRNAIAECLPNRKVSILVPVLERFVDFHMSLNMISEETHSMVLEVIESCRMQ
ncbi:wings apart-like protein 2 isoform X1 [Bidens hawaiensis]|uniref:wings apart-like protein 2 isoform X1 n=1 Tax=Bidens hawaiensis TaxID=980011 RepID=UPI00404B705D